MSEKTVLAPCMGVGKIVASVTRRASYIIKGQCPEDVELLSLPALLAGDPHERELIQNNPSVVIDGCALRCAAHIYRMYGVEPVAKIEVNQIMKERRIGPGKTRKELEDVGKKLSDFTADRVLEALKDEGLDAQFSEVDALSAPPPEAGCGCPHAPNYVPPATPEASNGSGQYKVNAVTILPCQGIKRTGGRVTQRAAYHVVEDRFLGKSHVMCISALAAGVQEDIDMLEKYPTIAVNGCGLRCASIAAEHHGVPAVAHVELDQVDPQFNGGEFCFEPDLTEKEAAEALKLTDAIAVEVEKLLGSEIDWKDGKVNLHGLVHEPLKINSMTGFKDNGKGFLVKLVEAANKPAPTVAVSAPPVPATATVASASSDEFPGLKSVVSSLFKPKGGTR